MPTLPCPTTPFYGGGQVVNPANVIKVDTAPSTTFTDDKLGTLAVDNATATIYGLASKAGGQDTWIVLGGGTGAVATINTLPPTGGNITIAGTANQIGVANAGSTVTLSLPAAITAPGSLTTTTTLAAGTTLTAGTGITATTGNIVASTGNITSTLGSVAAATSVTAGTTLTATLGNITATNGNLVMGAAGNKLIVPTGANASAGTSGVMAGTPGVVTVATTACSATALIFYSRATTGGTPGDVSITAQDGTGFTLTSTANETSTFNWWIINA